MAPYSEPAPVLHVWNRWFRLGSSRTVTSLLPASFNAASLPSVARVCGIERECKKTEGEAYFPYPIYPEPGGLLPWGNDENSNDYYWWTGGPPDGWVVVQNNNRGSRLRVQPYSMTGFLVAMLRGEVKPLASDYPEDGDLIFQPFRARRP